MTLQTLFLSPNGRIARRDYWLGMSVILVVYFLPNVLALILAQDYGGRWRTLINGEDVIGLVLFYPGVCLYSKRLHDLGLSGWFQLILYAVTIAVTVYAGEWAMSAVARIMAQYPHDRLAQRAAIRALPRWPHLNALGYATFGARLLLIVVLGLIPGQPRDNGYGPAPDADAFGRVFRKGRQHGV